jgi:hypothetical protein
MLGQVIYDLVHVLAQVTFVRLHACCDHTTPLKTRMPFELAQVVDAGDLNLNTYDILETLETIGRESPSFWVLAPNRCRWVATIR